MDWGDDLPTLTTEPILAGPGPAAQLALPPRGSSGGTVSPVDSNRVWAIVEAAEGGLFRSDDAGKTVTYLRVYEGEH